MGADTRASGRTRNRGPRTRTKRNKDSGDVAAGDTATKTAAAFVTKHTTETAAWQPPSPKNISQLCVSAKTFVPRAPTHDEAVAAAVALATELLKNSHASNCQATKFVPPNPRPSPLLNAKLPPVDEWDDEDDDILSPTAFLPSPSPSLLNIDSPAFKPSTRYPAPRSCPLPPRQTTFTPSPTILGVSCSTVLLGERGNLDELPLLDLGVASVDKKRSGGLLQRSRATSVEKKSAPGRSNNPFSQKGQDFAFKPVNQAHPWRVYFEEGRGYGKGKKEKGMEKAAFQSNIAQIGSCASWNDFAKRYGTAVPQGGTLWLFAKGIEPVWEDKANQGPKAGKWIIPTTSNEASVKVMREAVKAISSEKLNANGVLMTHKFGQALVMIWMDGEQQIDAEAVVEMLGAGKDVEDMGRVRYKQHQAPKQKVVVDIPEADANSDYDASPVIAGQEVTKTSTKRAPRKRGKKATSGGQMWADM